jgi:hypothetical protein
MRETYIAQVSLLIETIPFIAKESCFALKGGTAINLFYRQMPRLSVDIDLVYTGFEERQQAYQNINGALERIAMNLDKRGYSVSLQGSGNEQKLVVANRVVSIKIEPNYTHRGYNLNPCS